MQILPLSHTTEALAQVRLVWMVHPPGSYLYFRTLCLLTVALRRRRAFSGVFQPQAAIGHLLYHDADLLTLLSNGRLTRFPTKQNHRTVRS